MAAAVAAIYTPTNTYLLMRSSVLKRKNFTNGHTLVSIVPCNKTAKIINAMVFIRETGPDTGTRMILSTLILKSFLDDIMSSELKKFSDSNI